MKEVLKQVNTVAGVIGSMICDDQGTILDHVFPPIFDESMLRSVVAAISENMPSLEEVTGGMKMADFAFQNGRIVVKPVAGDFLVILCESKINLQVLAISLNVASVKFSKIIKTVSSVPPQGSAAPVQASSASAVPSRELFENGPLSAQLQGMQTALAKFMGPMAKIIFSECLDSWLQTHQPVKAALPQLVDIVAKEIDDPAKESEYRQKVSVLL
jgi:predicted regulator of Ras-like GTPase activity (Roadblock/LC7/MglB family)